MAERIAGSTEAQAWRRDNLDRCLAAFAEDALGTRIETDDLDPAQVASLIVARLRLD